MSDAPATPSSPSAIDVATWTDDQRRATRRPAGDVRDLIEGVLAGTIDLDAFGHWLVALADLGESATEIAGVAAALRGRMLAVAHGATTVADTCGTGGDGSGSFNISTAAGIIVTRVGGDEEGSNLGQDVGTQLTAYPRAIAIAAS